MASLYSHGDRVSLPKSGKPGDVHFWRNEAYLVIPDGTLVKTSQLFTAVKAIGLDRLVGPQGEPGKDSTIPGPKGEKGDKGDKGERGEQGPRGDITILGDAELQEAITKLKKQKAAVLAIVLEVLNRRGDGPATSIARAHLTRVKKALES